MPLLSYLPPITKVVPSPDIETFPCSELPTAPEPTILEPCWLQIPADLVNTHAAPIPALSLEPPMTTVLPSEDIETEPPCCAFPIAPVPTNFEPCCVHTPALRVNIHAAPVPILS